MSKQRTTIVGIATVLILSTPVGLTQSEAATPRAGGQCNRTQSGVVVGALRCTSIAGRRHVWQPIPTTSTSVVTGTEASRCDPNYDPCVPIASDVDCVGGSGNGPVFVVGPVRVIGADICGLDADHSGIGCERRR